MDHLSNLPTVAVLLEDLQRLIEFAGIIAFAATGAVAAVQRQMHLLGAVALGCTVAIGGGTLRDVLLNRTVFWVQDPSFAVVAAVAALIVILLGRVPAFAKLRRYPSVDVVTAAGMAIFVTVGTDIALAAGAHVVAAVAVGAINGVGGGFLRDIATDTLPAVLHRSKLHAASAIAGGAAYIGFLGVGVGVIASFWISVTVAFVVRSRSIANASARWRRRCRRRPGGI